MKLFVLQKGICNQVRTTRDYESNTGCHNVHASILFCCRRMRSLTAFLLPFSLHPAVRDDKSWVGTGKRGRAVNHIGFMDNFQSARPRFPSINRRLSFRTTFPGLWEGVVRNPMPVRCRMIIVQGVKRLRNLLSVRNMLLGSGILLKNATK